MSFVLVDSNIIIDVINDDPTWSQWSSRTLEAVSNRTELCINPIIYSEISVGFSSIEKLDVACSPNLFRRLDLPWEAAFLAGRCFMLYRKRGGTRRSPLPDFYIGAHAAVESATLLTRDATRYMTYFPKLKIIAP